jgi:hypothetical protein
MRHRIYVGAVTGALMAGLTGAVSPIEGFSDNLVAEMAKPVMMSLIVPGLFGSAVVGGNVHAYSLGIAVVINGIIYFALGCFFYSLWIRIKKLRHRVREAGRAGDATL